MLINHPFRELSRHPLRTGLAVTGVAVATAMLLDMLMLGAGLQRSFKELLTGRGYQLRVSPRGALPLDTDATLARAGELRVALEARPEVAGVAPVLAANLLRDDGGAAPPLRFFVVGVDPAEQGLYRLLEGRELAAAPGDEVPPGRQRSAERAPADDASGRDAGSRAGRLPGAVVSRAAGDAAGVGPGDTLRLAAGGGLGPDVAGARLFTVRGVADFLYASRDERPVAVRLPVLQRATGRDDRVSFFMVRVEPGVDPDTAAVRLAGSFPRAEVASVGQLVERAQERLSYFRQLALILGTVSLAVTALLVGTIMAVSVSQREGTIAALRALGVSRRSVVLGIGAESLALCAVAAAAGLGLGVATAGYLEGILAGFPGLPRAVRFFVLRPEDLARGYAAVLAAGLAAALVPAWRAAGLEIAATLHREEP